MQVNAQFARTGMSDDNLHLLDAAIARNGGVVVSFLRGDRFTHHKSRFLAEDPDGCWVEACPSARGMIEEMMATGRQAGVSFKADGNRGIFAPAVLRRERNFHVTAFATVDAILLQRPEEIRIIQRRHDYRVTITEDSELAVRIWRMGRHADLREAPGAKNELVTLMRNLSIGGMGVTFRAAGDVPPRVTGDDRLRVELTVASGEKVLLEARMRHPQKPPEGAMEVRAGLQFKMLDDDVNGRQARAMLVKIVGEIRRREVRRYRLGLS